MSVDSKHPQYDAMLPDWQLMRDSYMGERKVKSEGQVYLPATPGQILDGLNTGSAVGMASYNAYVQRAVFPDMVEVGTNTLIGILNAKNPQITLPPQIEYLRTTATLKGESLTAILRKIHLEQLVTGRVGLLADLPQDPDQVAPKQYIALYGAEAIINWDAGEFNDGFSKLNMVILDESGYERESTYDWKLRRKHRILTLGALSENEPLGAYMTSTVLDENEPAPDSFKTPMLAGKTLEEIPFVLASAKDLDYNVDLPPLLGLARLCMTIYRGEADYRQSLFLQGQDTLVVIGGVRTQVTPDNPTGQGALRVGAGARIDIEMGGDAKYVGIGATGLPEQRTAIENDRMLASVRTGQLMAPGKMSMESGEALKTRVAAQTATLTSVALASCAALERLLKMMAVWQGGDPEAVKVSPNLDFTNIAIQGQDLVQVITAKNLGFPLSYETLFNIAKERGLTRNTFEEEMKKIEADPKTLIDRAAELSGSLAGNNPQQSAGGPKASTAGTGAKSNKPKE